MRVCARVRVRVGTCVWVDSRGAVTGVELVRVDTAPPRWRGAAHALLLPPTTAPGAHSTGSAAHASQTPPCRSAACSSLVRLPLLFLTLPAFLSLPLSLSVRSEPTGVHQAAVKREFVIFFCKHRTTRRIQSNPLTIHC